MADLRGFYDPNVEPSSGFEILPAGLYTAKITKCDWKNNKNTSGKHLLVKMTVTEGEYAGAVIFDRFNLENPSNEAVHIAKGQLLALCNAVGIRDPKDSAALEGIRFQLVLKCEKRNDDPSKMTNRVQRYIEKGQTVSTPQQHGEAAPWARNAPKSAPSNDASFSEIPF